MPQRSVIHLFSNSVGHGLYISASLRERLSHLKAQSLSGENCHTEDLRLSFSTIINHIYNQNDFFLFTSFDQKN